MTQRVIVYNLMKDQDRWETKASVIECLEHGVIVPKQGVQQFNPWSNYVQFVTENNEAGNLEMAEIVSFIQCEHAFRSGSNCEYTAWRGELKFGVN